MEVVTFEEVAVVTVVLELTEGTATVVDTSAKEVLVDSAKTVVEEEAVWSEPPPRRPKYAPTPAPASTMTTATAMPTISPARRRGGGACHPGVYPEGGGGGGGI